MYTNKMNQLPENKPEKVPFEISEYLNDHFDGGFHSEIKPVKQANGLTIYHADISQDNTSYHLKFNSDGKLIANETEPLHELDDEDDSIFQGYDH